MSRMLRTRTPILYGDELTKEVPFGIASHNDGNAGLSNPGGGLKAKFHGDEGTFWQQRDRPAF